MISTIVFFLLWSILAAVVKAQYAPVPYYYNRPVVYGGGYGGYGGYGYPGYGYPGGYYNGYPAYAPPVYSPGYPGYPCHRQLSNVPIDHQLAYDIPAQRQLASALDTLNAI